MTDAKDTIAEVAADAASLPHEVRLLLGARLARSLGQGALVVDFTLYLDAFGWSSARIGLLLTAGLVVGGALTLLVGPFSDRIGRKRFLLAYEAAQILAALAAWYTANPGVLVAAAIVGAYGRGGNGSAGPFGPVEQAWLTHWVRRRDRGNVFSLNNAVGFSGMTLGALVAMLPGLGAATLPPADAYRFLFLVVAAGSLACIACLMRIPEDPATVRPRAAPEPPTEAETASDAARTRAENRDLLNLLLVNGLSGLGMGLTGPLIAYWFALRYGKGPELIGPMMALSFALSAGASLFTGRLSLRLGMVRATVVMRLVGLVLMVLMPLMPSFGLAAALYVARAVFQRGSIGARQALGVSLVRARRRGLAASLNNAAMQFPRAIGPLFGGLMFDAGLLVLPFMIGAAIQAGHLYLYDRLFRRVDLIP
jgi:MFS family permease